MEYNFNVIDARKLTNEALLNNHIIPRVNKVLNKIKDAATKGENCINTQLEDDIDTDGLIESTCYNKIRNLGFTIEKHISDNEENYYSIEW